MSLEKEWGADFGGFALEELGGSGTIDGKDIEPIYLYGEFLIEYD